MCVSESERERCVCHLLSQGSYFVFTGNCEEEMSEACSHIMEMQSYFKGIVGHFGKYALLLSCPEVVEKIDATFRSVHKILSYNEQLVSLA